MIGYPFLCDFNRGFCRVDHKFYAIDCAGGASSLSFPPRHKTRACGFPLLIIPAAPSQNPDPTARGIEVILLTEGAAVHLRSPHFDQLDQAGIEAARGDRFDGWLKAA